MKICIINNLYKPYQRGGAEKISEIIFHGLVDRGHDVFVVTTRPYFQNDISEKSDFKVYRFRSLFFNLNKIPFFVRVFWHFFDMLDVVSYFKMKRVLAIEKPDLVISGNLKGLGFLLPTLFDKKKLTHIHILHDVQLLYPTGLLLWGEEGVLNTFLARVYQKINKKLFSCVSNVVSPSKWLLKEHEKFGFFINAKKKILPNPVTVIKDKTEVIRDEKVFTFLFIGHLTRVKGVDILLQAYKALKEDSTLKPTKLILVGGDELSEENKKLALTDDVEVFGFVGNDKVKALMRSSNFLVVPSLCYENSPTVIYEAFFCNLPFITSDLGGAKELASEFKGQVFKPGDVDDLARGMKEATKKTSLQNDFKKGNSKKLNNYSVEVYIDNILKLIR